MNTTQDEMYFVMSKVVDYKIEACDIDTVSECIEDLIAKRVKKEAIRFREYCEDKQQPHVRNGYQGLSTEDLYDEFIKP